MGPNTTGLPNTSDYLLGRGILYFALLDSTTKLPKAWRDLGNATEFKVTVASESLDHNSSRAGLKVVDKSVVISQSASLGFSLDEANHENLALFFSGAEASHTNVAIAGFAKWTMVPIADLAKGRWYDIRNSAGNRAYDVKSAKIAIETTNVSPVALVEGTDYTLDSEMGRIFTIASSTKIATAITNGEGLAVTLTADGTAKTVSEVQALTTATLQGAVKFVGENPANNNEKFEAQFHSVTLKANGDLSLIGDDYTAMTFEGKAEKNTIGFPSCPTGWIRKVG